MITRNAESLRRELKYAEIIEDIEKKLSGAKCPVCKQIGLSHYVKIETWNGMWARALIECKHCGMFSKEAKAEGKEVNDTPYSIMESSLLQRAYDSIKQYFE